MEKGIKDFLQKLPEEKRAIVLQLRELMLHAQPGLTEAIKWRNLTIVHGKTNIALIYTYPSVDYINLGFLQAMALQDPDRMFEGIGKGMRHIKIRTVKEIPRNQIISWVNQATALGDIAEG